MYLQIILSFLLLFAFKESISQYSPNEAREDFHTVMMNSTYKIEGANHVIGTCFILIKFRDSAQIVADRVLITARHVLDAMPGDSAIIYFSIMESGSKFPVKIPIRKNGNNLYVTHPNEDVAALYVPYMYTNDLPLLTVQQLANDKDLEYFDLHPGDELFVLGYPRGLESNVAGFPVLRRGILSSYPVLPIAKYTTFKMDFQVFQGNSGGPVYLYQLDRSSSKHPGAHTQVSLILGLVSKENISTEEVQEEGTIYHRLSIADIVSSYCIIQTINLLP